MESLQLDHSSSYHAEVVTLLMRFVGFLTEVLAALTFNSITGMVASVYLVDFSGSFSTGQDIPRKTRMVLRWGEVDARE